MSSLYSEDLLACAAEARDRVMPAQPDATAVFRNPLCGDQITVGMVVASGVVTQVGFAADACAVCTASAAVMARTLQGLPMAEIGSKRASIEQVLVGDARGGGAAGGGAAGEAESAHEDFGVLSVLADHPSRRSCALLPWNALENVVLQIESPLALTASGVEAAGRAETPGADAPPGVAVGPDFLESSSWSRALELRRRGEQVALATLVAVVGSSPCPLGSRMVISGSGAFWGSVSGGCVEAGVVQAGLDLLTDRGDTSSGRLLDFTIANSQAGESLFPCGGEVQIYVERAPTAVELEAHLGGSGDDVGPSPTLRITNLDAGDWRLLTADEVPALAEPLRGVAEAALAGNAGLAATEVGSCFVEPLRTVCRLVLVGGTHIAQKLAAMAPEVGIQPVIVDPREGMADPRRFPTTPCYVENPPTALDRLVDAQTAVVTLSHKAAIDDPALTAALAGPGFYVAALGSRKTQAARLARLEAAGVPPAQLARLRGPAGLPIGGKGAGEIAVSILAEIIAERRQRERVRKPVVGAMVLAAGSSKRAGAVNKLLYRVDGVPMVVRSVQAMIAAGVAPVVVVLGHDQDAVREALQDLPVEFVEHPGHAAGMGTSIAAGIRSLSESGVDAALVALGDMPFVRGEDVRRVVETHQVSTAHLILVPEYRGGQEPRAGHPVLWPRRYFGELLQLRGDVGGKSIIQRDPGAVLRVPVEHEGVLIDIDRPD